MAIDFSTQVQELENALVAAGIPLEESRASTPNQWMLRRGSALILVLFKESQDHKGDVGVFLVLAHMLDLPQSEEVQNELAKALMSLNHQLIGERFTHYEGAIYLMSARPVQDLQASEMMYMIDSLSYWADKFDDIIKERFGDPEEGGDNGDGQR